MQRTKRNIRGLDDRCRAASAAAAAAAAGGRAGAYSAELSAHVRQLFQLFESLSNFKVWGRGGTWGQYCNHCPCTATRVA